MLWMKQIRGPYMCYALEKDFLTTHVIEQKPQIMQEVATPEHDIALDIRKLRRVDNLSLRFLVNLEEMLEQKGRKLVMVGGEADIVAQLKTVRDFHFYPTMADFELEFHDVNPGLLRSILNLAQGGNGFKMLRLECPLCHFDDVRGFVLDESKYQLAWSPREITPVWIPAEDGVENIDYPNYRVAVCPHCFYASPRPDHFTVHFPEGAIEASLRPDQITSLTIHSASRKALAADTRDAVNAGFFHPPREAKAGYLSWKLHEACQKQMNQDRHFVDAFEIVLSNFMMCKYAGSERLIDDHLHAALAWLNNLMKNQDYYSTARLLQAYTYQVSVLLALEKIAEAQRVLAEFRSRYSSDPNALFWLTRAESLINEALADLAGG